MDEKPQPGWIKRTKGKIVHPLRWLVPGLGVKRWLIVVLLGTTMGSVGLAFILLNIYRTAPDTWWLPLLQAVSLQALPRLLRAVIFGGLGLGLILIGIWGFNRSLMAPFLPRGRRVVDALANHRRKERGPRVVAIGGGHGLATLLRGMKEYTHNLTAIVAVADDGGSSGRLRETMGILPPGDIRNCLAALSDDEAMLTQLFQYRFPDSSAELEGHSFGNLFISALSEIMGSFEEAVAESGRVLSVNGRVLPSTLHNVRLLADVVTPEKGIETRIEGESSIPKSNGKVRRVWLEPDTPQAFPMAVHAILAAEMIVVGPGSIYTSLLPNLLVPDIVAAIEASRAYKVYICNLATQPGETDGYTCGDHIRALEEHTGSRLFDIIVVNNCMEGTLPEGVDRVTAEADLDADYTVHQADVLDEARPWRHSPVKLAQVLIDLYQQRSGHLIEYTASTGQRNQD